MIAYNRNDKRRLYWLIDQYVQGVMEGSEFCDEFYYSVVFQHVDDAIEREKNGSIAGFFLPSQS